MRANAQIQRNVDGAPRPTLFLRWRGRRPRPPALQGQEDPEDRGGSAGVGGVGGSCSTAIPPKPGRAGLPAACEATAAEAPPAPAPPLQQQGRGAPPGGSSASDRRRRGGAGAAAAEAVARSGGASAEASVGLPGSHVTPGEEARIQKGIQRPLTETAKQNDREPLPAAESCRTMSVLPPTVAASLRRIARCAPECFSASCRIVILA